MDEAHDAAAAGAPAGTLIVADAQTQGRGRAGRSWSAMPGAGLWLTLIERPLAVDGLGVLSLRVGLGVAKALDALVPPESRQRVRVKWPNDLYLGQGKLAGVLIEARWREQVVDWVAIGIGVNMRVPEEYPQAAAVDGVVSRADLLRALLPEVRGAALQDGVLTDTEMSEWHSRDFSLGRRITGPIQGVVQGISPDGALLVLDDRTQEIRAQKSGSIIFADS